jgi:hypothetical protein
MRCVSSASVSVAFCLLIACSSEIKSATSVDEHGTLIPWNASLVALDSDGRTIGAAVVGLSDIELLDVGAREPLATVLVAPASSQCDVRQPIAVAAGDLAGGDGAELLVLDPCGSWAVSPDGEVIDIPALSTFPVYDQVSIVRVASRGFLAAVAGGLHLLDLSTGEVQTRSLATPDGARVTRAVLSRPSEQGGVELLAQRLQGLSLVSVGGDGVLGQELALEQVVERPYRVPFDAFDSLSLLGDPACPWGAVGISQFIQGDVPRRLQLIKVEPAERAYSTVEVPSPGNWDDTVSVTPFPRLSETGGVLVGVLGRRESEHVFQLAEVQNCESWSVLLEAEVEFALRTPEAPGWNGHPATVPPTNHATLIAYVDDNESAVRFVHYDGYDLRTFVAERSDSWVFKQTTVRLHEERQDLSILK